MITGNRSNIIEWYTKALDHGLYHERDWYRNAHNETKRVADELGVEHLLVIAVVAILSPGLTWEVNIEEAARVIKLFQEGVPAVDWKCPAYGHNARKVEKLLETGDLGLVSGPKVTAFYWNMVDPEDSTYVTIDRHALRVWFGELGAGHRNVSRKQFRQAVEDYISVARELHILPCELQAVTWCAYRSLGG